MSLSHHFIVSDTMVTPVELLEILEVFVEAEFKKFKWLLQQADILEGFPAIPKSQLENADRLETVDQIDHGHLQPECSESDHKGAQKDEQT